ncbi:MAG TPA: hypothetical protein VG893_11455 [Terracidiphilus sp.]|nr:hypothetical protein [Terracidiphilus sp.]
MDQTLQLAFRIALVWAAGFLVAVAVRALLPSHAGLTLTGRAGALFIPFSRIGFWTCMLAALTVTALVVLRAAAADIGWTSFR